MEKNEVRFCCSSAETKIYPAHKCENANNWHFNIYEQDKLLALMVESKIFNQFGLFQYT